MANSNNYTLILQAKIDEKAFQTYLNSLKKFNVTLNATVAGTTGVTSAGTQAVTSATNALNVNTQNLNKTQNTQLKQTKQLKEETKGLTSQITQNVAKVIQWAVATTMIYGSLKALGEGVEYVKELDKALTNISIVTGKTRQETTELGLEYNRMAQRMGVTTAEIAEGSLEWFRQGKTVEETSKLMQSSLMMSKLGNMEAAQATEYLTSVLNGFKFEAEDASMVVDKLVAVDNSAATSVAELASALQRSSNSAQQAGVDFDTLVAYIGTVSSVTRKSAESIGESFKTVFARMQNIKLGKMFEDDATTINDVEKALSLANVALRDSENSFRDMSEVIEELAGKWETLDPLEQSAIANAIAGVRQRENFLVLMNNFNQVLEMQAIQADAAGQGMQRYGIYLESVEAAANKMKAAWEGVWQYTFSTGGIKSVYSFGTAVAKLVGNIGGLVPVIMAVAVAFSTWKIPVIIEGIKKLLVSLSTLRTSFKFTGEAANAAFGVVGLVIGAIILGISAGVTAAKEKIETLNAEIESLESNISLLEESGKRVKELGDEYDKLKNKLAQQGGLNTEEWEKFYSISNELHGILPSVGGKFDDLGRFVFNASIDQNTFNESLQRTLELQKELLRFKILEGAEAKGKNVVDLAKDMDVWTNRANKQIAWIEENKDKWSADVLESQQALLISYQSKAGISATSLALSLDELKAEYSSLLETQKESYLVTLRQAGLNEKQILYVSGLDNVLCGYEDTLNGIIPAVEDEVQTEAELAKELKEVTDRYNELTGAMDVVTSALKEQADNGHISAETMFELVSAHASLLPYLKQTADGFELDAVKARDALYAEMQLMFTERGVAQAAVEAAKGNYIFAASAIAASKATAEEKTEMLELLGAFSAMSVPVVGGGAIGGAAGGLSSKQEAEIERLEDLIDSKEEEKEALQEKLDNYKKIIDARKDLLKSYKDELDYKDELAEKEKSVAEIQRELTELAFDNSEEAQRKRIELQEQLAEAEADLNKTQRDRAYELQIEALDKELEAYEEFIDAQIEAIDKFIESIEKLIDAIRDATGGAGSGNTGDRAEVWGAWYSIGGNQEQRKSNLGNIQTRTRAGYTDPTNYTKIPKNPREDNSYKLETMHSGVEKGFVGGLKGNEEFAKLMDGELVVNPMQMERFMRSVLPQVISNSQGGNISLQMPITVEGNLDKTVIPEMERIADQVIERINKSMSSRGFTRTVNQYGV